MNPDPWRGPGKGGRGPHIGGAGFAITRLPVLYQAELSRAVLRGGDTMKTLMLLGMLLIPSLAWAGGWLVWVELTLSEKDHAPATTWGILGVKETEQTCQAAVNEYVAHWEKPLERGDEVTVKGYTVTVRRASPPGASEMYRYSCLPAGSDPRDAREK